MGLFVTLTKPTAPMRNEAASAGVIDTPFGKFARLQILTIEDLFSGKKPAMPPQDPAVFKKAAREEDKTRQGKLISGNRRAGSYRAYEQCAPTSPPEAP